MDVQTVTMDAEAAAAAFKEYRAAFMAERNRIDGELMRGYKALAEGRILISLSDAIQRGGVDEIGRPRLAIARADESGVSMERTRDGAVVYWPSNARRVTAEDRVLRVPATTLPDITEAQDALTTRWGSARWRETHTATLPFIPPKYRPPLKLDNYHLLWEAEWRSARQRLDPMLLRRVGGDLFAIVAAWDLTEVEKLVLAR